MGEKKLKVLAVDDDMINLKLLKTMLMKTPNVSQVVEAKNGADAIGVTSLGLLYFCQASQSMTSEKEKIHNRMRRRLSMNDLLGKEVY